MKGRGKWKPPGINAVSTLKKSQNYRKIERQRTVVEKMMANRDVLSDGRRMFEVILWRPVLIPVIVSVVICFCAEAMSRKIWLGPVLAELFSILFSGFLYVVGAALLNDAPSVSTFLAKFFFSPEHVLVLAFFSAPALAGHLARRFLITKSGRSQAST